MHRSQIVSVFSPQFFIPNFWSKSFSRRGSLHFSKSGTSYILYTLNVHRRRPNSVSWLWKLLPVTKSISLPAMYYVIFLVQWTLLFQMTFQTLCALKWQRREQLYFNVSVIWSKGYQWEYWLYWRNIQSKLWQSCSKLRSICG